MVMPVRLEHPLKDHPPISVNCSGKVTFVMLAHPEKAPTKVVTPSGMVMLVKLVHPEKARSPIVVTLLGMVMPLRLEHP